MENTSSSGMTRIMKRHQKYLKRRMRCFNI
nr:MAG TPA: hypothetical protein [Caudoviricetes sp.]